MKYLNVHLTNRVIAHEKENVFILILIGLRVIMK